MAALVFPIGFYINEVGGQPYKLPNNTVVGSSYVLFVLSIFFTIVGLLFAGKVCLPGWHALHFLLYLWRKTIRVKFVGTDSSVAVLEVLLESYWEATVCVFPSGSTVMGLMTEVENDALPPSICLFRDRAGAQNAELLPSSSVLNDECEVTNRERNIKKTWMEMDKNFRTLKETWVLSIILILNDW